MTDAKTEEGWFDAFSTKMAATERHEKASFR
jgi:hypothetical protein